MGKKMKKKQKTNNKKHDNNLNDDYLRSGQAESIGSC